MAMNTSHPAARKLYGSELQVVVPQRSYFYQMKMITSVSAKQGINADQAIFVEMNDLAEPTKNNGVASGYQVTFDLDGPLTGYATPGDTPDRGRETNLSLYTDLIQINQFRRSTKDQGLFNESLIPHQFRERAKIALSNYWAGSFDEEVIVKASGTVGDGTYLYHNSAAATTSARDVLGSFAADGNDLRSPSTNRIVYGNGRANQAALVAGDVMSIPIIEDAIYKGVSRDVNSTLLRTLQPVNEGGMPTFCLVMDVLQARQLKETSGGLWYDMEKARLQGGFKDSGLISKSLGVHMSAQGYAVALFAHPNMVKFSAATTGSVKAARALLLGQSALRIARGRDSVKNPKYRWHEETDDRGNINVITTGNVYGIQKCAYLTTETGATREDWGVVGIDTYANWG